MIKCAFFKGYADLRVAYNEQIIKHDVFFGSANFLVAFGNFRWVLEMIGGDCTQCAMSYRSVRHSRLIEHG